MRIALYMQAVGRGLGGVDCEVATLAAALSDKGHEVALRHHKPGITTDLLTERFGVTLRGVSLLEIPRPSDPFGSAQNPIKRYQQALYCNRVATCDCDVAVVFATEYPPFCHATRGVLRVIFPMLGGLRDWPFAADKNHRWSVFQNIRALYHRWEWKKRLRTYHSAASNSDYTRRWTEKLWAIKTGVIYPPVPAPAASCCTKVNRIITVGRIDPQKHQKELLIQFLSDVRTVNNDWEMTIAGALDHTDYYNELKGLDDGQNCSILSDLSRKELTNLYAGSSIYWHAAGYGENEDCNPERAEHFGITTVEAMAAGCVPVVINKAGQREVVEHERCGFLWDNFDELIEYTRLLMNDKQLLERMSVAAQQRAKEFTQTRFTDEMIRLIDPVVDISTSKG